MKLMYFTVGVAIFFSLVAVPASGQQQRRSFYVALDGHDEWTGTLASANQNNTDGPFATLERARTAVREAKRNGIPSSGISVYIRGGEYPVTSTFELSAADSGAPGKPVVWLSYPGERAILFGGKRIEKATRVADEEVLNRLSPEAASHVYQLDLTECGIQEYGEITPRGGPGLELFIHGHRMTLARWPNSGWLRIADVPQTGDTLFNQGLAREKRYNGVPVGRHYGRFVYEGSRPALWSPENEIYVHGYWTFDWSDSFQKVKQIDTVKHEVTLAEPHHNYGYTKNQRYYFLNILEELDTPGEWYLDRARGRIYVWPDTAFGTADIAISVLDAPLVSLDSANNVEIRSLSFECSRGRGAVVIGCTNTSIAGCTFHNLGGDAVVVTGGSHTGVRSCDIYDVALGGIRLAGGDRKTLVPGNNYASNNHIHHYSTWLRTGQYAVFIEGVGQHLDHTLIHDAPFEAIYLRGNDHLIEYNEIHHVTQETGDAGALHTGRDWTWRGNVIRYNYFHHLLGPGLHGVMGVYLDDFASGFTVFGNLFYRAGRASFIGGGRDNTIENNVYVECAPSVHVDARGLGWASYYMDGTYRELFWLMDSVKYNAPPYSTRYPELTSLYADHPAVPKHNRILRNVSFGGRWLDIYDYQAFDFKAAVTMKDNYIADTVVCRRRADGQQGWDPYYLNIDTQEGYVALKPGDKRVTQDFEGNIFSQADPGFVDMKKEDFRFRPDAQAFRLGFQPLPLDKMGLTHDEFRP